VYRLFDGGRKTSKLGDFLFVKRGKSVGEGGGYDLAISGLLNVGIPELSNV
jgi:hypothetical protein